MFKLVNYFGLKGRLPHREFWAPAKSQVIGISGLQAIGYTLGRLLLPWLKKKNMFGLPTSIRAELPLTLHPLILDLV